MIVGTGVDLAEVAAHPGIHRALRARNSSERIYTPAEIAYVERKANRFERYAARFAAKEAGMKAIGTGWRRGVTLAGFRSGQPALRQADAAASTAWPPHSPRSWA